jgi:pantoate ligase/cytidylate kinase
MRLFTTIAGLRCYLERNRGGKEVGFVPTMGALHAGHFSLIERARRENALVIVSIFVNPLQFGPTEDLQQYPRQLEQDRQQCEQLGVDAIFAPTVVDLYGDHMSSSDMGAELTQVVPPPTMTSVLCGRTRKGHFEGVATVVTKLLNLVQPERAYFGQKDAQQLAIIQRLVADLNLPVTIVACPTVREESGLAYSSRNRYLTPTQKAQAPIIFRALQRAEKLFKAGEHDAPCTSCRSANGKPLSDSVSETGRSPALLRTPLQNPLALALALAKRDEVQRDEVQRDEVQRGEAQGSADRITLIEAVKSELAEVSELQVEYIELVHPVTLAPLEQVEDKGLLAIAVRLGTTRLIDNVLLRHRKPIVAIDGPAGAGKSTVARLVARALGLLHLDTGAMYRAVTWRVMEAEIDLDDQPAIAELVSQSQISLTTEELGEVPALDQSLPPRYRVWIDGKDITQAIRSMDVTANVSAIAAQPAVRRELVKQQQRWACKGGIVVEGRDIGTHVFPDAELKIFLTASVQERARRRQQDLKDQNLPLVSLEKLERDIQQRDIRDSTRALAPLCKAADAIEIVTDGLSIAEVTERIVCLYHQRVSGSV